MAGTKSVSGAGVLLERMRCSRTFSCAGSKYEVPEQGGVRIVFDKTGTTCDVLNSRMKGNAHRKGGGYGYGLCEQAIAEWAMRLHSICGICLVVMGMVLWWGEKMNARFDRVRNPSENIHTRLNESVMLDELHRRILQKELAKELAPYQWGSSALSAIKILGLIGDKDVVPELMLAYRTPHVHGGREPGAIENAIHSIEDRHHLPATQFPR